MTSKVVQALSKFDQKLQLRMSENFKRRWNHPAGTVSNNNKILFK